VSIPDDPASLLDDARQSLIDADREPQGSTRRRSFAHHAETQCADLIVRPESSEMQRAQASVFLEQAQAIQKEPATDPPEHQLSSRVAQRRQQRDNERTQGPPSILDATANHLTRDITAATNGPTARALSSPPIHVSTHRNPTRPTR
jgi:hypothetical protein